jgi:hypothetical protein
MSVEIKATNIINRLNEIQQEYSYLLKRLTLEERTKYKPQYLTDLVEEKRKAEDELIQLSQKSALLEELFSSVHPDIQKALQKRGLVIKQLEIVVPKLELSDLKEILMHFDNPSNQDSLKQDLLMTVTSDYRFDERYGDERIIRFKRKNDVVLKHSFSVLVAKYIRQNLRDIVRRLYPIKYDRNDFNSFFSQYVRPSNKFLAPQKELMLLLVRYEDFISGKEIRVKRKKNLKNREIPGLFNFQY